MLEVSLNHFYCLLAAVIHIHNTGPISCTANLLIRTSLKRTSWGLLFWTWLILLSSLQILTNHVVKQLNGASNCVLDQSLWCFLIVFFFVKCWITSNYWQWKVGICKLDWNFKWLLWKPISVVMLSFLL